MRNLIGVEVCARHYLQSLGRDTPKCTKQIDRWNIALLEPACNLLMKRGKGIILINRKTDERKD